MIVILSSIHGKITVFGNRFTALLVIAARVLFILKYPVTIVKFLSNSNDSNWGLKEVLKLLSK